MNAVTRCFYGISVRFTTLDLNPLPLSWVSVCVQGVINKDNSELPASTQ